MAAAPAVVAAEERFHRHLGPGLARLAQLAEMPSARV
jgi:hypothetical protein